VLLVRVGVTELDMAFDDEVVSDTLLERVGEKDGVPDNVADCDDVSEAEPNTSVCDTVGERDGDAKFLDGVPVRERVREGERDLVAETEAVRVLDGVTVHVVSPEGVPLLDSEEEPEREPVPVGVPVDDAPVDNDLVADGVTEDVRVELLDIVCVRDDVSVAVFELLTEGGGHVGVAPSSIRRIRLLPLSAIHSVEPATATPEGA
jgi:hypothetical protein